MKVSVIVPTYNRAAMITATLRSIEAQSYRDLEIVVVDDGSTDHTEQVVAEFAASSPLPLRYLKKENGGCSSARNAGIRVARGDCLAFLDSDDQFLPDAIGAMVEVMTVTGADFVYSPVVEVARSGRRFLSQPAAAGTPERFVREHFLTLNARCCAILYRRGIFGRFMFEEKARYNEDSDLLQRVALNYRAAYSATPTALIFEHGGNKSGNRVGISRAVLASCRKILADYPEFAESLASEAAARLERVTLELVEALVFKGLFGEAAEVLGTVKRQPLLLKLATRLGSPLPARLHRRCDDLAVGVRARLGGAP